MALGEGALHQALALSLRLPAQRGVPREVTAVAQLRRVAAALGGQRSERSEVRGHRTGSGDIILQHNRSCWLNLLAVQTLLPVCVKMLLRFL